MTDFTEFELDDFSLDDTFDCGQCFRWEREPDGSYTGTAFGRTVNMALSGRTVRITGASADEAESVWKPYLDAGRDYSEIKSTLGARDDVVKRAIVSGEGIRLLAQDPWETLISFIVSQNNNIPRIKKCIEKLSGLFGEELPEFGGKRRFAFPTIDALAALAPDDLADIHLGYRAPYITETAKRIAADGGRTLHALADESVPAADAYSYLISLPGVGPKVANCIMLFGLRKYASFPIDVWVRRVMHELYGIDENDKKAMERFAALRFGEYGGFAQQYLFYYMKNSQ